MMPGTDATTILERDAEHAAIASLIDDAARGDGGLLLFQGPAGIGKTALLRDARATAEARGISVLAATASPFDRELPFGLVHQLFDPVVLRAGERVLAGAASRAGELLLRGDEAPGAPTHALLHGLYWLCANLAEVEPIAILVDDLHWADVPSLRFLEFLSRRLDGLRVAVIAGTRPPESGAKLLATVSRPVVLEPLSARAAADLLASTLGGAPDRAFAGACHAATGGNPLLLRELARAAAEHGLEGEAAEAERVRELSSEGLAAAVEQRVAGLGAAAVSVARAAAIFGPNARVDDLAALAGVNARDAATAARQLDLAGILEPGAVEFVHPLVREAVLANAPLGELHGRAASRLKARGARPTEIAVHLLHTRPAGARATIDTLRTAAREAVADGALDTAVSYLRRALEEPPARDRRGPLLAELGEVEAEHGVITAAERLGEAIASGQLTRDETARARAARARQTILRDPPAAADDLEVAVAEAEDPDVRLRLQSLLFDVTAYDPVLDDRRAVLLRSDPTPVVLAHRAQDAAYRSAPAEEVTALAREALAGGELLRVVGPQGTYHLLLLALRHAEQPALAAEALAAGEAEVRRIGSRYAMYFMDHARAYWELMYGSIAVAEAHARSALAITEEARLTLGRASLSALLAEVLIERGRLAEAEAQIATVTLTPVFERMITGADVLGVRAELHLARGRLEAAEAEARRARELIRVRGWTTPLKALAGIRLGEILLEAGRREEALAVLAEEEAAARRAGTPGTLGMILRAQGRVDEAVTLLERSEMRLELARVLIDAGDVQRAYEEATRIGAVRLAERALAAGARPSGEGEQLTPEEHRVAALAAEGLSDREIAEALWVTRRTVEQQLAGALAKLGLRTRAELVR